MDVQHQEQALTPSRDFWWLWWVRVCPSCVTPAPLWSLVGDGGGGEAVHVGEWGVSEKVLYLLLNFALNLKRFYFNVLVKQTGISKGGEGCVSIRACRVLASSASFSTSFGPKFSPGVSKLHSWVSILLSSDSLTLCLSFPGSTYFVWTCVPPLGMPIWSSEKEPETIRNVETFRPIGEQWRWRRSPVLLKTAF